MALQVNLPQEMIDAIIDHLHDDKTALSKCALVSPAWLPSAHHHLFHTLRVLVPRESGFTSFFQFIVSSSPSVCESIVVFELGGPGSSFGDLETFSELDLDAFRSVLSRMPNLTSLSLHGLHVRSPFGSSSHTISSKLSTRPLTGLKKLVLTNIALKDDNLRDLSGLVALSSGLEELHILTLLDRVATLSADWMQTAKVVQQAEDMRLKTLSFGSPFMTMPIVVRILDSIPTLGSSLTSLDVRAVSSDDLPPVGKVLGVVGPNLRYLGLDISYLHTGNHSIRDLLELPHKCDLGSVTHWDEFNLRRCTSLQEIRIQASMYSPWETVTKELLSLTLSHLFSAVQTLHLILDVHPLMHISKLEDGILPFPGIKTVKVLTHPQAGSPPFRGRGLDISERVFVVHELPRLNSRGILRF
ncbi:hypothetical protein PHLCEN_2v10194 [Hermanssonia centrifuga]|uniref:F-box domain-containing protein n=1 Tax=Hermanssonia centrifuga TaxID=98765 RepID=A0A2R6NNK4_9APHY|nr:hypothetical protein PHLCEN_2v10194 [Hermanssonia centrifuga]